MGRTVTILSLAIAFALTSCAPAIQPFYTERVQPGIESKAAPSLKRLPAPQEKVVAAVYRFSDQTGQYKPSEQVASWSTAVTQGATTILVKAMENSGWFVPIERENLSNLLNERKIINSTRAQNNDNSALPPLLFAGVLLEGGIIGYDTNIMTGGAGARYLGTGLSGQYRKDQVTIYLRAVSTQTGRILKTVHTTKSIISQELQGGVFKFVDTNRLLETEAGYTYNEPPVMAVTEAIDEALKTLVIEGVDQGLWSPSNGQEFEQYKQNFYSLRNGREKREVDYFGLERNPGKRSGLYATGGFIYGSHIGNFSDPKLMAGGSLKLEYFLNPSFSLVGSGQRSKIGAADVFSEYYIGFDLNVRSYLTSGYSLSPYVGLGAGGIMYERSPILENGARLPNGGTIWFDNGLYSTLNAQAGIDYRISQTLGIQLGVDYRYLLRDGLDGVSHGNLHDQQWNIVAGLTISPGIFN